MKDIQNQLMNYGDLPLNIARGTDRDGWEGRISPVPDSELSKLWGDPSTYPVGLIELGTDTLATIFAGGRELSHVFENEHGVVIDVVQMNVIRDRQLGRRVYFSGVRQFEYGWRRYQLTDTELLVFEGSQPGDKDEMLYRPFLDTDGKTHWQLLKRTVKVIERPAPDPNLAPAYLNYLYKNIEKAITKALKLDEHGSFVGDDIIDDPQEVTEAFTEAALQNHPLGAYNHIPTDTVMITWFRSTQLLIAAGGMDHTDKGVDAVVHMAAQLGEQFAELAEPFVQQAMRNNPVLARDIAKQDEEGSPDDEDEDEEL